MTPEPEHILILEDDPRFWAIVAHNLSRAGYKVTAEERAAQALLLARQTRFDLVISDDMLPDYPGTDFIRLLREIEGYDNIPVILWSARVWELDTRRLRDELAVLIMSKGCSTQELVDAVSGCLSIANAARC